MAKQVITKLLCDVTGEDADETVSFALDGNLYSIDLTRELASELRTSLDKFLQSAERVGKVGQGAMLTGYRPRASSTIKPAAQSAASRARNSVIRAWADENGYSLAVRGRIPQHVQDAYDNRHNNPQMNLMGDAADAQGDIVSTPGTEQKPKKAAKKPAPAAAFAHA